MMKIISIIKLVLTVFLSVLVSLYMFETYQILFNAKNGYEKIIEKYYNETGKEYDERTKYEIYNDLKKVNKDISVSIYPMSHLKKKEIEIFPLSGISNVNSIHCNENGYYSIYKSDRYGFNNPDEAWDKYSIDFLLIGDSYTHGACVNRPNDIGSVLRKLSNKNVINLAFTGNGPLIQYAVLKEYINPNVKNILWIYYAGNDLTDLNRELDNEILKKYLSNEKFHQNLISKQSLIDKINKQTLNNLIVDTQFQNLKKNSKLKYKILKFLQLDRTKDKIKVLFLKNNYKVENLEVFEKILKQAKELSLNNNSKLYFIYLPDFYRHRDANYPTGEERIIESLVQKLDIPIINIQKKFFQNRDKLKYYPFKIRHHYTKEGYLEITKTIYKFLDN